MGGVLVDDDDAVAGLGDDVGLVHLGPRGAEGEGGGVLLDMDVGQRQGRLEGVVGETGGEVGLGPGRDAAEAGQVRGRRRRGPAARAPGRIARG